MRRFSKTFPTSFNQSASLFVGLVTYIPVFLDATGICGGSPEIAQSIFALGGGWNMQWPSKVIFGGRQPFQRQEAKNRRLAYKGLILPPRLLCNRLELYQQGAKKEGQLKHRKKRCESAGNRTRGPSTFKWQRRILLDWVSVHLTV